MNTEKIDYIKLKAMEKRIGCTFCNDGIFAEMIIDLTNYKEKTQNIDNVEFGFYKGDILSLKKAVSQVNEQWVQYFNEDTPVFCGYVDKHIASFCIVQNKAKSILEDLRKSIGSIGCVGTLSQYRGRGIGLRMLDLATLYLKNKECSKSYISYTHIDTWYEQLGYHTFARFSFI